IELRVRRGQQLGHAAPGNLRMLDPGDFDPIAARKTGGANRIDGGQTPRDQFRYFARKGTSLLLDIDDAQCALALWLPPQAVAEPTVDDLQPSQWIAAGGVPPIEPVEDVKFVRRPGCLGDNVDRRHAAAGMSRENEPIHCER